jgi:hypothetical protein
VDEVIGEMILLLGSEANEYAVSIHTDLAADLPRIVAPQLEMEKAFVR